MRPCPSPETRHHPGDRLATHRHGQAYAALVVDGSYWESSLEGPVLCMPGTLLLHPQFHAHGNRFGQHGARVINLPLPAAQVPEQRSIWQVDCLKEAVAVFARETEALAGLLARAQPAAAEQTEGAGWQTDFIRQLRDSDLPIARIARHAGVSDAYASRSLRRSHGLPPQLLRRELRLRRALGLLAEDRPLADIAAICGFADQSHLSRIVRACTGLPPARLRRQVKSVQDRHGADVA
jgi:AraC family transcriptional regulator